MGKVRLAARRGFNAWDTHLNDWDIPPGFLGYPSRILGISHGMNRVSLFFFGITSKTRQGVRLQDSTKVHGDPYSRSPGSPRSTPARENRAHRHPSLPTSGKPGALGPGTPVIARDRKTNSIAVIAVIAA